MRLGMAKRSVLICIALFSIAASGLAVEQRPGCAVLTFDPTEGITAGEARFLTDRFSSLLQQTGKFDVLARSRMEELLQVAKFNRSGSCSAAECAIEAGRILMVRFVVFGTVGHVAELYSLNTSLVDVETGKILRSAITDHRGGMTDFVDLAAGRNLQELLGLQAAPQVTSVTPARPPIAPVATPRVSAARPITPPPPLVPEPPSVGVLFGPRVGASLYSGLLGVELQIYNLGLAMGAWPMGPCGGIKLYFSDKGSSAFIGLTALISMESNEEEEEEEEEENFSIFGFLAGYRWGGQGLNFSLGLGLGLVNEDEEDEEDSDSDSEDDGPNVFPTFDLSLGYLF
jgi:TolB-like protein